MNSVLDKDTKTSRKDERLAVRLSADAKSILENAANVSGRTLSEFVVTSALTVAREAIEDFERMRLTEEDRAIFMAAFSEPAPPSKALMAAAERYKEQTD